MIFSTINITLDIHTAISQVAIPLKRGDTARKIVCAFSEGSKHYPLPAVTSATLRAVLPNGAEVYRSCAIENDCAVVELTPNISANVGYVECEIQLQGTLPNSLTSPRFVFIVEDTVYPDEVVEAHDDFSALAYRIAECNNLDVDMTKVGDVITITVTKKDGSKIVETVLDGTAAIERAEAAERAANSAKVSAQSARDEAQSAANDAQTSRDAADASAQTAQEHAESAEQSADNADAAKNAATSAKADAQAAQNAAEEARDDAESSASAAAVSAFDAEQSAERVSDAIDKIEVTDFVSASNRNALYGTVIEDKAYTFADLDTAAIPTAIDRNAALDGGEVKLTEIGGKSIVEGGGIVDSVVGGVKINGYNLWNEEWENGTYSTTTGAKSNSESALLCIRCKDFIKVAPDTEYYYEFGDYTSWGYVLFYNESKQFISYVNPYGKAAANPNYRNPVTTPSDCAYMTFFMHSNYGLVYKGDICVSFSSVLNETYGPYTAPQTIELPAEQTLRSARDAADQIRFVKQTNGTWNIEKVQTIGVVDLGTRNWVYVPARQHFYASGWNAYPVGSTTVVANLLAVGYTTVATTYVYNYAPDYNLCIGMSSAGTQLFLSNQAYTDATALRTALNGVMLNYELATPVVTVIAEGLREDQIAVLAELGGSIEIVGNTTNAHPSVTAAIQTAIPGGSSDIPDIAEIRRGAALGATAVQPEEGKDLFSGRYADLKGKPSIPAPTAYVEISDDSSLSLNLADNTEYYISDCTGIVLTYPEGHFGCYIHIAFGADVDITFPNGTGYIGGEPQFGSDEAWEISIKDGVVVAGKVE